MQLLVNVFFFAQQLRTTSGLRVIDNGLGPLVWGAEEKIVDYALLAADQKATLPSQVKNMSSCQVENIQPLKYIHPCKRFTSEKYSPLKNIHL